MTINYSINFLNDGKIFVISLNTIFIIGKWNNNVWGHNLSKNLIEINILITILVLWLEMLLKQKILLVKTLYYIGLVLRNSYNHLFMFYFQRNFLKRIFLPVLYIFWFCNKPVLEILPENRKIQNINIS